MGREGKRKTTLLEVAEHAGVSLATVSRVLSNADYPVSPETRKRVLSIAKEMRYAPNLAGHLLESGSSALIGVIVPTLQNPYFNQVVLGIESEAQKHNYEVIISSSHRSIADERDHIRSLLEKQIMGLIIICIDSSPTILQQYIEYGGHVALLEADFQIESAISAKIDYRSAGIMAAEYLTDRGHREIAYITSPMTKLYRREILAGIQECFRQRKIPFSDDDLFEAETESEIDSGMYEFEAGKQLMWRALESRKRYTAVIAVNDMTAFGAIRELHEHGLSIPEDMSIISFDNIPYSAMLSPPLTTVSLPASSMGAAACHFLINELEGLAPESVGVSFSLPCNIEKRESVFNRLSPRGEETPYNRGNRQENF